MLYNPSSDSYLSFYKTSIFHGWVFRHSSERELFLLSMLKELSIMAFNSMHALAIIAKFQAGIHL